MITFHPGAEEKLESFTPENTYLVADFDGTIIRGTDANSFSVFREALWETYTQTARRLYWIFRPHEANDKLDSERKRVIMARWWKAHLALFRKIPLTQEHLNEKLIDGLILREGMRDLIYKLCEGTIPIMVFSAGIAQVIEKVLERDFGTEHPMKVVANRLTFCPRWINNGVESEPIHTVNKTDIDFPELIPQRMRDRTRAIVIGDSLSDADMVKSLPVEQRLTIGFLNNWDAEKRRIFQERFDIVIESWECDGGIWNQLLAAIWIK